MKHAGPDALDSLEPILRELRKLPGLTEKKRGTFYRRSSAFIHFHEDPAGFFVDIKIADEFTRFPVNTQPQVAALLKKAAAELRRG